MDPFDRPPSRSSRRYSMNNSSFALPTLPSLGGSSFSSRLPSPNDTLSGNSGNDRFASSLDLPPLRGVPRSTSPLLSPSHRPGTGAGRSYSDFPSLPPLPPFPSSFSSSRNPNLPERTAGGRSFVQYPDITGPLPSHRPSTRSRRTSLIGGGSMDLDDLPLSTSSNRPSFLSRGSSNSSSSYSSFPAPLSSSSTVFDLPPIPPLSSSSQRTSFNTRGMADLSLSPTSPYSDQTTMQTLSDGLGVSPSSVELSGTGTHLASLYSPTSAQMRNSSSHASKGIRKYSKRATFSSAQLTIMEALWNTDQYPSVDQVDECASATGLTAKQIRTWFGNTRQARLAGTRTEARLAGLPGSNAGGAGGRNKHSMMPTAPAGFLGTSPPVGAGSHFPSLTSSASGGRRSDFPSPFPPSSSLCSSLGGTSMFPPLGDPFSSSSLARPVSRSRRNSVVGLPSLYGSTSSSSSGSSFGERGYGGGGSYGL